MTDACDGSSAPLLANREGVAAGATRSKRSAWSSLSWWIRAPILGVVTFALLAAAPPTRVRLRAAAEHLGWVPCDGCPLLATGAVPPQENVRFVLHSACKTPEAKARYAEFFTTGEKEAYVVRHNYGSQNFFVKDDGIKMQRVKLSDDEYGYEVTTDQVDFEWGFMLYNKNTTEQVREIGYEGDAMLAHTSCTQMYYPYFNRVMTLGEGSGTTREFVFGSCDTSCPDDYVDNAYHRYVGQQGVKVPTCGAGGSYPLGEGDDARLFTLWSAVLTKGGSNDAKFGRMMAFRDDTYEASKTSARWLVAGTEGADTTMMKVVYLDVNLVGGSLSMCIRSKKYVPFPGSGCAFIDCSPASYDMPRKVAAEGLDYTAGELDVSKPLYTVARLGDTQPKEYSHKFTNEAYLTTHTLHDAESFGTDADVRRIILTSAGTCGGSSFGGNCVGVFSAFPDTSFSATATEQRWIMTSFVGDRETAKMMAVRVYLEDGAAKIATIRSAWKNDNGFHNNAGRSGFEYDPLRSGFDSVDSYNNNDGTQACDRSFADGGYGIGSLKWLLAPEMVPSLTRIDELTEVLPLPPPPPPSPPPPPFPPLIPPIVP